MVVDFGFTDRHQEILAVVGRLGREKFRHRAAQYDAGTQSPIENILDFQRAGLLNLTIRAEHGGQDSGALGSDPLLYLLAVEETARHCPGTAQSVHIHYHATHLLDRLATEAQREKFLRPAVERGALLNATGSEPGRTARGLYGLLTTARKVNGGYIVNGEKNYATLADVVSFHIVNAALEGTPAPEGHLALIIPQDSPGLSIVEGSWNPLGMRAANSPNILLKDVFVPDENLLGDPGIMPRQRWQSRFHLSFAAQYVGASEGIFDFLTDYLPRRGTAGDAFTQLRLGEIRVAIDSARWLVYRAAWLWQQKQETEAELNSMLAKYRAIDAAVEVMDKAVQIAGSSALHADSVLSRLVRDLRVQTLHENLDKTAATIGRAHLGQSYDTTARL
jgi:alkylation response protein AidB-like acyl-CoA dehydrogenase